jgi:hypothetical protein
MGKAHLAVDRVDNGAIPLAPGPPARRRSPNAPASPYGGSTEGDRPGAVQLPFWAGSEHTAQGVPRPWAAGINKRKEPGGLPTL